MSADQLFEIGEDDRRPEAEPQPKLSTDRRRTLRQAAALAKGSHPLSVWSKCPIPLHAEAAPVDDRQADGRRCGNCAFRIPGQYAKCSFADNRRVSHGPATDLRSWWPACRDHQPEATS